MAYAFAVTKRQVGQLTVYQIDETELAAASEWTISDLPGAFTITHLEATLTSGTGTTLQPDLGYGAAFSVNLAHTATAAALVVNPEPVQGLGPSLVGRSTPDGGTDNVARTVFVVRPDHVR